MRVLVSQHRCDSSRRTARVPFHKAERREAHGVVQEPSWLCDVGQEGRALMSYSVPPCLLNKAIVPWHEPSDWRFWWV